MEDSSIDAYSNTVLSYGCCTLPTKTPDHQQRAMSPGSFEEWIEITSLERLPNSMENSQFCRQRTKSSSKIDQ